MTNDTIRVLFVDDDELVLRAIERALRREPCETHFTTEPTDALRLIQELQIDIIVCDHSMPEISGVELLGLVRRLHMPVVRVMLTGGMERDIAFRAVNEGHVHRFLEKPWQSTGFRKVLRELVEDIRIRRRAARLATRIPTVRDDGIARDERGAIILQPTVADDDHHDDDGHRCADPTA